MMMKFLCFVARTLHFDLFFGEVPSSRYKARLLRFYGFAS